MKAKKGIEGVIAKYSAPEIDSEMARVKAIAEETRDDEFKAHLAEKLAEYYKITRVLALLILDLTPIEAAVYKTYFTDGYSANETADELFMSRVTIWAARKSIIQKFIDISQKLEVSVIF